MKTRLMMIATALMTTLIALPASAQPGPGMGGMGGGMTGMGPGMGAGMGPGMAQGGGPRARAPRDCSQAPNPAACNAHREARAQAFEACKNTAGPQRRQCMQDQRKNFDCSKSANPQQCESRKMTYKEKLELEALPADIEKTEQAVAALEAAMADPAFFTQPREATEKTLKDLAAAQTRLQTLYDRWAVLDALSP